MSRQPDMDGDSQCLVEGKIKEPDRYSVLLHNDDYTSMEFVVAVLCDIFRKTVDEATAIMLNVHQKGGIIVIDYDKASGDLVMTGKSEIVFDGEIDDRLLTGGNL